QRQIDRREPAEKGGEGTGVPASRVTAATQQPTAKVHHGADQERGQEPGVQRPRTQESVERGAHGYCFSPIRWEPGSAAGAFGGRRFTMNSTRAVISAGLICLPNAGILPPPGSPLLMPPGVPLLT